ncbi:hypothetical protein ACFQW6_13005 [Nocardioides sp. GCM10028917]|uniref:hypothetical protein n=1 Tax=Nocardioides sp. GCM10028917 TaxID=3273408 RepID=UPI0036188C40
MEIQRRVNFVVDLSDDGGLQPHEMHGRWWLFRDVVNPVSVVATASPIDGGYLSVKDVIVKVRIEPSYCYEVGVNVVNMGEEPVGRFTVMIDFLLP